MNWIVRPLHRPAGAHDSRAIEGVELHHIDLHVPVAPIVVAPQRGADPHRRPAAPDRPDRPPWWIPKERQVGGGPITDTENDYWIVHRDMTSGSTGSMAMYSG